MKTLDRFDFMRLFVRIAETGSLSAAAQSVGISQPSASRQLRQLEALLGVQLVRRSTHDLALTDAGSRFLEDARAMLADWETSTDTLRNEREELSGLIRVAVPVALGQTILATIASRFLVKHPAVTLDWRLIDQPGDLTVSGYDLWVRAGPVRQLGLIVRHLWRIERTIVAAPSFQTGSHAGRARAAAVRGAVHLRARGSDADRATPAHDDAEDPPCLQHGQYLCGDRG